MTIKDSGDRTVFDSGAVRDMRAGKGAYWMMAFDALRRIAIHYEDGGKKYGSFNMRKGIPLSTYADSALRHLCQYIEGDRSEDHAAACCWNLMELMQTEALVRRRILPSTLLDLPDWVNNPTMEWKTTVKKADGSDTPTRGPDLKAMERTIENTLRSPTEHPMEGVVSRLKELSKRSIEKQPPKPSVYLAGPITGAGIDWSWREEAETALAGHGILAVNPLRGREQRSVGDCGYTLDDKKAKVGLAVRDYEDIKGCDFVLAHFPYMPTRQSIGTFMELGMAVAMMTPFFVATVFDRIRDHLFLRTWAEARTHTLKEAIDNLVDYIATAGVFLDLDPDSDPESESE